MGDDRIPRSVTRFIVAAAGTAIVTGVVVIVGGWILDVSVLRSLGPGAVTLKFSTATGLLACGLALLALRDPVAAPRKRRLGRLLAVYVLATGTAFLVEYVVGVDLGIDELPFRDVEGREAGAPYPGRLALNTALGFVLLGVALLCLDVAPRRSWRIAEAAAMPVAIVAVLSLVGYAYSIPAFYGPGNGAKMAVNTAIALGGLSAAIGLARPRGRFVHWITTSEPAAMMSRHLLPIAVLAPLVLGWLQLETSRRGVFAVEVGYWLFTSATIGVLVVVIQLSAKTLAGTDRGRRQLEAQLQRMANHDHLTGLFNRGRFEEELAREMSLARRHGTPGALLVLDLDRLKQVNDELGHEAGDRLLRQVAGVLRLRLRGTDPAGRIGGDEFAVYVPHASLDQAAGVADTLREEIASGGLRDGEHDAWSSASIGVAELDPTEPIDPTALLARADAAMYRAKRAGGDQVACAPAGAPAAV